MCALGELVELSVSGMRVVSRLKPPVQLGQCLELKISSSEQKVNITGRVVRISRKGLKKYELGIEFVTAKPRVVKMLEAIARFGYVDPSMFSGSGDSQGENNSLGGSGGSNAGSHSSKTGREKAEGGKGSTRHDGLTPPAKVAVKLPDLYQLLGVEQDVSSDAIKRAFRLKARTCHPDVSREKDAGKVFDKIHNAYKILIDPDTRKSYDTLVSAGA